MLLGLDLVANGNVICVDEVDEGRAVLVGTRPKHIVGQLSDEVTV